MRYVLHVGLPKCGSTSLQAFLSANAPCLLAEDVLYPCGERWPHPRQHSWIVEAVDQPGGSLSDLLHACRSHPTAVVSGESLTNLTAQQVATLKDRLRVEGGADEVRIVLYVRNIADMVLALCAEWVKVEARAYTETIGHRSWSISTVITAYETAFGTDAVDVRLLEDAPDLPRDFCTAAGLPWRDDYLVPPRMNVTADPLTSQLVQLLQTQFGPDRMLKGLLQKDLRLGKLENRYLAQIAETLGKVDLSHPKLARFADRLTGVNWRDEAAGPSLTEYLDQLILALVRLRRAKSDPAAAGLPG